jgi:hypothetical protein
MVRDEIRPPSASKGQLFYLSCSTSPYNNDKTSTSEDLVLISQLNINETMKMIRNNMAKRLASVPALKMVAWEDIQKKWAGRLPRCLYGRSIEWNQAASSTVESTTTGSLSQRVAWKDSSWATDSISHTKSNGKHTWSALLHTRSPELLVFVKESNWYKNIIQIDDCNYTHHIFFSE